MKDRKRESVYLKARLCVCTRVYAKQKADNSRSESCSGWWVGQLPTNLRKVHFNIWKCSRMLWNTCETFHGKIAGDALRFQKCQKSLINVAENLLFLHHKPPLINNTNLETSALLKHLSDFRSLLKAILFLLEIYFILNTFWVTLAKALRSMHHFAQKKEKKKDIIFCPFGNEGHLKTIKMFCTATFLCDNNRIIQTLRPTEGNSTFLRVGLHYPRPIEYTIPSKDPGQQPLHWRHWYGKLWI